MKGAEIKSAFPTEAALCECFIKSARAAGWTVYPETAGFDILCVYRTGHQLGVEAKLRLNAKVADQILPQQWEQAARGPDFRAVIVPGISEASYGIARMLGMLGVQAWAPEAKYGRKPCFDGAFNPDSRRSDIAGYMYDASKPASEWHPAWFDWNPAQRCELPEFVPSVPAGVPAPIRLTPWKIGALKVLAKIETDGFITAKEVRGFGVDPRRFCASDGWLEPLGDGKWGRGKMPAFDQQHPEAYTDILSTQRSERPA